MKIWQYIVRRLLLLIPVLFGVTLITFTLIQVSGDPAAIYYTKGMPPQKKAQIRHEMGLDQPIAVQYVLYLQRLLRGDLGVSSSQADLPVTECIKLFFPATFELATVSMIITILFGIPLGIVSAVKKDRFADHLTRVFALAGSSLPIFWLALLLQQVFFYIPYTYGPPNGLPEGWYLPYDGRYTTMLYFTHPVISEGGPTGFLTIDALLVGDYEVFWDALKHLILPSICLSYASVAIVTRMMRGSMLEVLGMDYIKSARAKGLDEKTVINKHARRNALIPTTTVIGMSFAGLMTGAVLTETVFSWPGLGRWSTLALLTRDIGGIMGFTLFVCLIVVIANLIVDILYAYLDPRVRLE